MNSVSVASGIALRRMSATAENWEHSRPDALSCMFDDLRVGTEAGNAAAVLAVAYLQRALEVTHGELFMFEQWPLLVLASWSLALKHVYEASTWAIDSIGVWNEITNCPYTIQLASLRAAEGLILKHSSVRVATAMVNFRSGLARVLVQEMSEMSKVGECSESGVVLIVEDDAFQRASHEALVAVAAPLFHIVAVSSFTEGMEHVDDGLRPDVVLVDMLLQEATGSPVYGTAHGYLEGLRLVSRIRAVEKERLRNSFFGNSDGQDEGTALIVSVSSVDFNTKEVEQLCDTHGLDAVIKKPLTTAAARAMCGLSW